MEPFVLLDDARPGGSARLYRDPVDVVEATRPDGIAAALDQIRRATRDGLHVAGFLGYEAGEAFEPGAGPMPAPAAPLAWFGLFRDWAAVDAAAWLPDAGGGWIGAPVPLTDADGYQAQVRAALDLIAAGDLYQVNLSFRAGVATAGDPLALYAGLRARAGAGYGAAIWTGADMLLSLSPELFFTLDRDRLTCRPMKGTAPRGDTPGADVAAARALAADEKNRAENLMIVDLLRNDLSRVAAPGSVAVPDLFRVETYPTVHQLTSTVTATLAPGRDAADMLAAAFPCGSITGAPKVRAMQAIAAIENAPRGPYCGAIGRIDADGDAAFNVAIRTLHLGPSEDGGEGVGAGGNGGRATLSLGAGIVADSDPAAEWRECLAKGAFVGDGTPGFDLLETMAFDPEAGLMRLDAHLARMKASAACFGFAFDRHAARNELQAATFRLRGAARVRLALGASGAVAVEVAPMPPAPDRALRVAVVPLPVPPADLRLRHKTADRHFYDAARAAAGTDEVVFEHDGALTEGSFTSLFADRGDLLVTPAAGPLLPGVLRGELLAGGRAVEGRVTRADLSGGFWLGNALRGLMRAELAL